MGVCVRLARLWSAGLQRAFPVGRSVAEESELSLPISGSTLSDLRVGISSRKKGLLQTGQVGGNEQHGQLRTRKPGATSPCQKDRRWQVPVCWGHMLST